MIIYLVSNMIQFGIFLLLLGACFGGLTQCHADVERGRSIKCYEQTKSEKCWDLK